jgi:FdhD protein
MSKPEPGARTVRLALLQPGDIETKAIDRALAIEAPLAIDYNGIGYAVMMGTPVDLEDFAIGFSLSEQLIDAPSQILSIDIVPSANGWLIRLQLASDKIEKVISRARQRVSESSCGLCGMDNLDEVMRPLPAVTARLDIDKQAIFKALEALPQHQPLNRATGAVHAAAFCAADGTIHLAREDVGRHNALDKVLGALARQNVAALEGFLLLTARASFELVQKAILANCPMLVTISAASDLAAQTAAAHNLVLVSLARADGVLVQPLKG